MRNMSEQCAPFAKKKDFDWLICKMPQELTSGDQKKKG